MSLAQQVGLGEQTAVVLLADIADASRLWGWSRIVRGPRALRRVPGLLFSKVLGSGYEGGFDLRPSPSRQGVFALFDSAESAHDFIAHSPLVHAYQERSKEFCWATLKTFSCRGSWDGLSLQATAEAPTQGPMAALTRASIKFSKAQAFWRHAPPSQTALEGVAGCQMAVGLGEAPFFRQATFSMWDSVNAMNAYARSGAHLEAIQAAQKNGYFSESMFARFVPLKVHGQWRGKHYA
ncbi:spheroidene monooxygenase [Limnohabitans sp.]|uniref:spheroidene monooxygenase n=1 Tax=Limnohabitans sp. TaxID=1907725 RepID=UPI002FDE9A95